MLSWFSFVYYIENERCEWVRELNSIDRVCLKYNII